MRSCPLPGRKQCPQAAIKERGVRTDGKSEQRLKEVSMRRQASTSVVNTIFLNQLL